MTRLLPYLLVVALLAATAGAQTADFQREGNTEARARKDPLEGKSPPALVAESWLNTTDGKALSLEGLRGNVVVLDFWGVW